MAATAAVQLNNTVDRIYFIGIDRRNNGLTTSARFQRGLVQIFGTLEENGDVVNTRTRGEIQEKLGISPATASRNNSRLINAGAMEKRGVNTYVYHNDVQDSEEQKFWYCPTEMFTNTYPGEDDDGNPVLITFTYDDCLVYAYFYTLLPHTGKNKRTVKASFEEIAQALDIDPSTVSAAITKLRWARFIHYPKGWIGKNRHKKSQIGLKRGFSWFEQEKEFRAIAAAKKAKQKVDEAAPNTPAQKAPERPVEERKAFYDTLQADAEKKAAKALAEAKKNKNYRSLLDAISDAKYQYNRAIFKGDVAAQKELSDKISNLEKQSTAALRNIGIDPAELDPLHYVRCKECNDTGWTKDGKACGCFNTQQRGAPPGNGRKKGVGESNKKN